MRSIRNRQRTYATLVGLGIWILLARTIVMISDGSLHMLVWWVSALLVLEFLAQGRKTLIGLVADRVFEVTNLDDDRLDPAPDTGCRWRSDHIAGIGRRGDKFVVVLDLERLLADDTPTLVTANLDAA